MEISLPYGRSSLTVRFPPECDVTVIRKPQMPVLRSPSEAVRLALANAQASQPLSELAQAATTACILVCDVTRPVPNDILLGPIVSCLTGAKIRPQNILILVATGLHRPNEGAELGALIGDRSVLDTITIANHIAQDDHAHINLGTTTRGTPVLLDRRFVEADLKLVTGLVEPHFMAGYSGGRKVVAPGIAHAETIGVLHSAGILDDPNCAACNIEGNPLHLEQLEVLSMLRAHAGSEVYAVNTVIDEDRNLAFVNFGEIESSHQAAMDFAARYCTVQLPSKFETIVTSAAGYPLDQTYYQAVKGMVTPLSILEKNGTLVLAAECKEGLGSDAYRKSQRDLINEGTKAFLKRISQKSKADIDEWETQMQANAQEDFEFCLVSDGLSGEDRELTSVRMAESLDEGISFALSRAKSTNIAVIPEGPYVVPQFR